LGREESVRDGEVRPVERRRRALLGLAPRELEDEAEREEKTETALGDDKLALVSVERRDGRRVEQRASPAATAAVWAAYEHSVEQENTVEHSDRI